MSQIISPFSFNPEVRERVREKERALVSVRNTQVVSGPQGGRSTMDLAPSLYPYHLVR